MKYCAGIASTFYWARWQRAGNDQVNLIVSVSILVWRVLLPVTRSYANPQRWILQRIGGNLKFEMSGSQSLGQFLSEKSYILNCRYASKLGVAALQITCKLEKMPLQIGHFVLWHFRVCISVISFVRQFCFDAAKFFCWISWPYSSPCWSGIMHHVILMIFHRGGHIFVSGLENIWLQSNPLDPIVSIQVRTYSSRKPWCLQFYNSEL